MAKIKIESGRVVRHAGENGAFIVEEYKTLPDGRSWPVKYTVWNRGTAPAIDDIVTVHGELGVKVSDPDANGKRYANISINDPVISIMGTQAENIAKIQQVATDLGNSLAAETSEAPF